MGDFTIKDMLIMQQTLQEKYKDKWETICPDLKPAGISEQELKEAYVAKFKKNITRW